MSPATRTTLLAAAGVAAVGLLFFACFERHPVERSSLDSLEAQTNPYYAAGEFVEAMGASAEFDRSAGTPEAGASWILSTTRIQEVDPDELRSWLLGGGRLVLLGDRCGCAWNEVALFEEWGVVAIELESAVAALHQIAIRNRERPLALEIEDNYRFEAPGLETTWWIADQFGATLLGFPVGEGEVIVAANDRFVRNDAIAKNDHAELLWRLLGEGRPGALVRFTIGGRSESDAGPNLLSVLWERARPLVVATLVLLLAWVWMRARRFGPVAADPPPIRRRLLEHVEATGNFAWRLDRGASLIASMRNRLERECALRHPGWRGLPERERERELASLARLSPAAVARALRDTAIADADTFRERVFHLERMRRAL